MLFPYLLNYINSIFIVKNLNLQYLISEQCLKDYHDVFDDFNDPTFVPVTVSKSKFPFIFQIGAVCRVSDHLQYCLKDAED